MIRQATINDLERMTIIYNQAIESRTATGETEMFTPEQRKPWFTSHNNKRTPLFVYEDYGAVLGYCTLTEYRPGRQALQRTAEISYYVDYAYHRSGIGNQLVQHIIHTAKELGYLDLLAILLSCNDGSIALLKKFNFQLWGTFPDIAHIDDKTYSHCYYGLKL